MVSPSICYEVTGPDAMRANTYPAQTLPENCRRKTQIHSIRPSSLWDQNQTKTPKRNVQSNITDEHRFKSLQQILASRIQQHIKRIVYHDQVEFIPRIQAFFNIHKSMWYITLTNWKLKTIWSSQYMQRKLFKIFNIHSWLKKEKKKKKTLQNVVIEEGTSLNIKAIYNKPIAKSILNGEKLKAFPLRLGTKQRCPL